MKPYVKQYDEFGVLTNPITKENPYLHAPSLKHSARGASRWRYWAVVRNMFFTGRTAVRY